MDILRHRPLFLWCALFMTASVAGAFLPTAWAGLLGGMFLGGMGVFLLWRCIRRDRYRALVALVAVLSACLGLLQSRHSFYHSEAADLRSLAHTTVHVTGVVTDSRGSGGYLSSYALSLETVNGEKAEGLTLLTCHYLSVLRPGNRVDLVAEAVPLSEASGDGYDAMTLVGDGYVMGLLSEDEADVRILAEESGLWSVRAGNLRRRLSARLDLLVGREGGGLPSALLLGDKTYLSDRIRRDFTRAGVSHLLAISGLHLTLLFGLLAGFLARIGLPKRLRAVLLGAGVLGYLILLGFPPSATRAAVMLGMTYLSHLVFAQADALTSLGVAGALILAVTPYAAADAGFWMSFLATLGILTVMPLVQSYLDRPARKALPRWWSFLRADLLRGVSALAVGLVAVSFTAFIVAAVIGELGVLSPLSTILLTPFCTLILVLSLLCLPLFGTAAGSLLGVAVGGVSRISLELTERMSAPSWVVVSLRSPTVAPAVLTITAVMTAAVLLLLVVRLPARGRILVLFPLVAGWMAVGGVLTVHSLRTEGEWSVTYLQPSTVSESLVMVSGGKGVVCDLSNGSLSAMMASAAEARLMGANELAVFMLTHYHTRTPGALDTLLQRETVRALWLPYPMDEEEYELLLSCAEKAENEGVPLYLFREGEPMRIFGNGVAQVERSAMDRSEQPVLLISLERESPAGGSSRLVYCGSAVFESDLAKGAEALVREADTVIFGSHGPLFKKPFGAGLVLREGASVILSEHGNVAAYLDPVCLPEGGDLWRGQKRWILNPSERGGS